MGTKAMTLSASTAAVSLSPPLTPPGFSAKAPLILTFPVPVADAGRLVLHLNKDTYELLGLPGRPSAHGAHRQSFGQSFCHHELNHPPARR